MSLNPFQFLFIILVNGVENLKKIKKLHFFLAKLKKNKMTYKNIFRTNNNNNNNMHFSSLKYGMVNELNKRIYLFIIWKKQS